MICKNCGSRIPEESLFCLKCGTKIEVIYGQANKDKLSHQNRELEVNEGLNGNKEKTELKRNPLFSILLVGILIIVGLALYILVGTKFRQYNNAQELAENGNYEQAIEILIELDDYKDSKEKILEFQYLYAVQLMENEEYVDAIDVFTLLESYNDSKVKIQEAYYYYTTQLIETANYIEALNVIEVLDDSMYSNKQELKIECKYKLAIEYYEAGRFSKAVPLFEEIIDNYDVNHYLEILYVLAPMENHRWVNVWDSSMQRIYELDGWCLRDYVYFNDSNGIYLYKELVNEFNESDIINGELNVTDDNTPKTFVVEKSQLKITYLHSGFMDYCESGEHPITYIVPIPQVGMTAEDVRNSRWGEPEEVNKTTYSWGTTEQWCYSGYRYVYFENGVVTAISE